MIGRALRVAGLSLVIAGVAGASAAHAVTLSPSLCAPNQFNASSTTVNNPYFPLPPGQKWALFGVDEGRGIGFRVEVLGQTQRFRFPGGVRVTTLTVKETEWLDDGDGTIETGETLLEEAWNYWAQATNGTVCYFGERVNVYSNGTTTHPGEWRADDPGAAAGIQMPSAPRPGMEYLQESSPGIAEDRGKIVGGGSVTVPLGTFTDTVRVAESNPFEGKTGYKSYARDVGLILDDPLALLRYGPTA